jgi:hypothetical protein
MEFVPIGSVKLLQFLIFVKDPMDIHIEEDIYPELDFVTKEMPHADFFYRIDSVGWTRSKWRAPLPMDHNFVHKASFYNLFKTSTMTISIC